jgi:hypothetical protein
MCLVAFIACILKKPDIEEEDGVGEDLEYKLWRQPDTLPKTL